MARTREAMRAAMEGAREIEVQALRKYKNRVKKVIAEMDEYLEFEVRPQNPDKYIKGWFKELSE